MAPSDLINNIRQEIPHFAQVEVIVTILEYDDAEEATTAVVREKHNGV